MDLTEDIPEQFYVAVYDTDERNNQIGAAMRWGRQWVVTCAHVVNRALKSPLDKDHPDPDGSTINFTVGILKKNETPFSGKVRYYSGPQNDDLAIIQINQLDELNAQRSTKGQGFPPRLSNVEYSQAEIKFNVYSRYKGNRQHGAWVDGVIKFGGGKGQTQLNCEDFGVEQGYSGGPVFNAANTQIYGIVSARHEEKKLAFMVKANVIENALNEVYKKYEPQSLNAEDQIARVIGAAGFSVTTIKMLFKNRLTWLCVSLKDSECWELCEKSSLEEVLTTLALAAQKDLDETLQIIFNCCRYSDKSLVSNDFQDLMSWLFMQRAKVPMTKTVDLDCALELEQLVDIEILLAFHLAVQPNINFSELDENKFMQPLGAVNIGIEETMPAGRSTDSIVDETISTIGKAVSYGGDFSYNLGDQHHRQEAFKQIKNKLLAKRKVGKGVFGFIKQNSQNKELNNEIRKILKKELQELNVVEWKPSDNYLVINGELLELLREISNELFNQKG